MKMIGSIFVAGESEVNVGRIYNHVTKQGYSSIPCKTVQAIIEELKVLTGCGEHVSLVIIEPEMLKNINNKLAAELLRCFIQNPFHLTIMNSMKEHDVQVKC